MKSNNDDDDDDENMTIYTDGKEMVSIHQLRVTDEITRIVRKELL